MLAGEQFCGEDWSKLKEKYHTLGEEDLSRYCFSSAYIVALLHDSLGINLDDRRYANYVDFTQFPMWYPMPMHALDPFNINLELSKTFSLEVT